MSRPTGFRLGHIVDRVIAITAESGEWTMPPASRAEALKFRDALSDLLLFADDEESFQAAVRNDGYWPKLLRMTECKLIGPQLPNQRILDKSGFVYLMRNRRTKRTKIGFSIKPAAREGTLQCEEPDISMFFYGPATMRDEKALHRKFADQRIRGEWFNLTIEEIKWARRYIEALPSRNPIGKPEL